MIRPLALIQADEHGLPYSPHGAAAGRGFELLGYELRYFGREQLNELPLTPETVVVGGVGTVYSALELLKVAQPLPLNLPPELHPFAGRRIHTGTVRDLRESGAYPIFVKPASFSKLFQGRVLRSSADLEDLLAPRSGYPDLSEDTQLQMQEVVSFRSEWRAFVLRDRIVGLSHYAGDPLLFPSPNTIRLCIGAYRNGPAGYAADFGVTDDGRSLLIELNDGYSLSHGGLVADVYAQLLRARWGELVSNPSHDP